MTAPISNGPTTHGYTTMRDATLVAEVWLCALPRSPPVPSGPSGALHTSGAWLLVCGSVRRLEAWPCRHSPPPRRGPATGYLERRGCASLVVLLFRAGCAFWIGYVPIQNVITYPDCYLLSGSGACQRL